MPDQPRILGIKKDTLFTWSVILVIGLAWIWFNYKQVQTNCQDIAVNRVEGHARFQVQHDFIVLEADRNRDVGDSQLHNNSPVAAILYKYADKERALLPRIHDLPDVSC